MLAAVGGACRGDAPTERPPTGEGNKVLSLEFAHDAGDHAHHPAFALTASDGTGLRLVSLEAGAVVQGPLALTQLHLTFDNPRERTLEGRFDVTMPEGAAISRFAMKIGDAWVEGEVVERHGARVIYESYLHRRIDPALLEHDAGNRFHARVFPIPARERKELIIAYSQELADPQGRYRLPLRGLPTLDVLDVRVFVADPGGGPNAAPRVLTLTRSDVVPDGDLVLRGAQGPIAVGMRHGTLVAARVPLTEDPRATATTAKERVSRWTLLFDTSASQAPAFAERARGLKPLIAALAAREEHDVDVEVIAFDQEQVRIYEGPIAGFDDPQIDALTARGALGASDLEAALRAAKRGARRGARVLLVSDGIATLGATDNGALSAAAADLRAAGITRIDALSAGNAGDRSALRAITVPDRTGASAGAVVSEALVTDTLVDHLLAPLLQGVEVVVPGSRWVWPQTLDGVQPGEAVLVFAELDEDAPVRVHFRGGSLLDQSVPTTPALRPLLERAWRGAQIRDLTARYERLAEGDDRRALRQAIVDTSIAYRVLSPFTAMLVLETEADYRRFELDRRGLSDILVVGDAGLEVIRRDLAATQERTRRVSPGRPGAGPPTVAPDPSAPALANTEGEDTDRDGIPDAVDRCPMQPEDLDGDQDDDGCPDVLLIDHCSIRLGDRIYFEPRSAALSKASIHALDEVVGDLLAAPDVSLWVDGHADSEEVGPNRRSKQLSQRRVDAVIKYLVKAGIEPERLIPRGFGEEVPIADNRNAEGRADNRRVEFNLTDCDWRGVAKGWYSSREAGQPALEGRLLEVEVAIGRSPAEGLGLAQAWWSEQPGDVLAALALGRAEAGLGERGAAARAFASLIDLSPSRAEFRRHAGQRLEALGAVELATDPYRKAAELRPDHPSSHRLLAVALARLDRFPEAFAAAQTGLEREYPRGRFPGIQSIFREDLAILGAAWIRSDPADAPEVQRRLAALGASVADAPSLRFVLTWETDAADVDLHVLGATENPARHGWRGAGAYRRIDNTSGFGPETYVVRGPARDYPYTVNVHYARRGAAGHAMGAVQVLEHDGHGRLGFATLPFVLMREGASLDVGAVAGPLIPSDGSGRAAAPRRSGTLSRPPTSKSDRSADVSPQTSRDP